MLNRYYSTTTNIDVVQQPNDAADAARLYGETERLAKSKIEDVLVSEVEPLHVKVLTYAVNDDMYNQSRQYYAHFKVNDQDYKVVVSADDYDRIRSGNAVDFIVKHIVPEITRQVVLQIGAKLLDHT